MPRVHFIEANGKEHDVEVPVGTSAMQAATSNFINGIDGDCGGNAACATCHVFVDSAWLDRTGRAHPDIEIPLLEMTSGAEPNSRLACQIILTPELDGVVLRLPEKQF
jgi:ferredoxin, 2Fe-2S